jgi:hypothetical protein
VAAWYAPCSQCQQRRARDERRRQGSRDDTGDHNGEFITVVEEICETEEEDLVLLAQLLARAAPMTSEHRAA